MESDDPCLDVRAVFIPVHLDAWWPNANPLTGLPDQVVGCSVLGEEVPADSTTFPRTKAA